MKKQIAGLLLMLVFLLTTGCGQDTANQKRYVMLTDPSGIASGSLEENVYRGVETAAMIKPCVSSAATPGEASQDAYKNQIKTAVKAGAKVIVSAGEDMSVPVYDAAVSNKKIRFVLVEGYPMDQETYDRRHGISSEEEESAASDAETAEETQQENAGESGTEMTPTPVLITAAAQQEESTLENTAEAPLPELAENTCIINASAQDSGYLIGYALVTEGYRRIGFMGGSEEEDAAYASGLIQGADRASQEKALPQGTVTIRCTFTGDDALSPLKMDRAMQWYEDGTEVIFAPREGVRKSVIAAAELLETGGYVAASGLADASQESPKVIMTAVTDYKNIVSRTIQEYENNAFRGGETVTCGILDGCVTLSVDYMRMVNFTDNAYSLLMSNISNGIARIARNENLTGQNTAVNTEQFGAG